MAQLKMTETQQSVLTIAVKNRRGNPAAVQNPTLVSSDPAVVAVEFDPANPSTAVAKGVAAGTALITYNADADLGEGVKDIIGTLDVVIDAGEAIVVEIAAGTPIEQT